MEITSKTSFNSTNIQIIKIICVFVGRILYMLLNVEFLELGLCDFGETLLSARH